MREQILQAVESALLGSGRVKITLKQDAIDYITCLWIMEHIGIISLEDDDLIKTISDQSYNWDNEQNRTFMIALTEKFDKDLFMEQMREALDKIEVVAVDI